MYRRMTRTAVLAIVLLLAAGVLHFGRAESDMGRRSAEIQECILYMGQRDGGEGVSLYTEFQENIPLWIDSYESEGRYYLFLPAILRGAAASWGEEDIVLREGDVFLRDDAGKELEICVLFGSEIPCAWLDTESGSLKHILESKENREMGFLCFVGADGTLEYADGLSKVKIRGNATRLQPKSPFRIKLNRGTSLAGLGKSEDYVLLAEYGDISLMRNRAAMEIANSTTELYEPSGEHIDLYVNGEYMGVYLLCEGISIGENRLEIDDLEQMTEYVNGKNVGMYPAFSDISGEDTMAKGYEIPCNPDDITGGYLLELEYPGRYEGEESTGFRTEEDWALVIKKPAYASREQVEYIREQFQHVENAMYAQDWTDADTGKPLEELVDLESFVHKYLVDEICMNTDLWTSQFLYKDKGEERFYFGPIWDYDMAFGHYDVGFSPEEFYANWHIWYGKVYDNPEFQKILKKDYEEQYLPVLKELTEVKIPAWKELIKDSAKMNFIRWNTEEIYNRNYILRTGDGFEECADWLSDFIRERTEFLSSEWLNM